MTQPFTPAVTATRAARVAWWSIALSLVVICIGVLLLREALVAAGDIDGSSWLAPLVDRADGATPSTLLSIVGGVVALVGLWLVVLALGRRVRTRLALSASPSMTIGIADAARLARSAAEDVDLVLTARASATRRRVKVTVTAYEGDEIIPAVEAAVTARLEPLAHPLAVKVVNHRVATLDDKVENR
jgi:hypothetical protein